ncbi:tetratricopeptide repeat protein [Fontimonas sp. SYSU GA230001]|uniref:tetratricopeptide repeat protein n=1 Tax=Fontimonas sp. SYSU GA230001 TaxID=3142450 RepID=UPI0032B4BB1C
MSALRRTAVLAAVLLLSPAAFADSVSTQAQVLIEQGKAGDALQLLDKHLGKNPQDAEARFMRGLALVRLDRNKDAIRVFADLTRDYPQLPEPYNNLAVLYAAQGDYDKAREALEAALATHPSYATAHENLGDIYAALAGAAYNRALALDESNQMLRRKLSLINQLDSSAAPAVAPKAQPAPATAPAVAAPTTAVQTSTPPAADAETRAAVQRAIDAWTGAWSKQDLNAYFAAYADTFTPEAGLSRSAWEAQRRDRIGKPRRIRVAARDLQFNAVNDKQVQVSFRQEYESDTFADVTAKALDMVLTAGGWKIAREYTR